MDSKPGPRSGRGEKRPTLQDDPITQGVVGQSVPIEQVHLEHQRQIINRLPQLGKATIDHRGSKHREIDIRSVTKSALGAGTKNQHLFDLRKPVKHSLKWLTNLIRKAKIHAPSCRHSSTLRARALNNCCPGESRNW